MSESNIQKTSPQKKRIPVSVVDFARPVPMRGSIDALSGFDNSAAMGQLIHERVQAERVGEFGDEYQPEVVLSHEFETEDYIFQVGGRLDGLFSVSPRRAKPLIEEIKTTFRLEELRKRLRQNADEHPYCLQLKTYGYLYWLAHKVQPELRFHLVSTRNSLALQLELGLHIESYEAWLAARLAELVEEVKLAEERVARRKMLGANLKFPFENPRPGQLELVETIEAGMASRERMLLQAPTGLGKTVGVLYPSLRESLSRGQRTVYLTPKNSQHAVAEDAIDRFRESGCKVKALTVTAKSKICMKNEPLCNPDYCEFAKDHYTKVSENRLHEELRKKRKLTARTFKKMAQEYEVCPYELQFLAAQEVDTVICDYNYAFAPMSTSARLTAHQFEEKGKPNLVIDEAHNIPSRAMDYFSPELSCQTLEYMREEIEQLPNRFRVEGLNRLNECLAVVRSCQPTADSGPVKIQPRLELFLSVDNDLREWLSRYLESDVEVQQRDVVLRLSFYWAGFTAALASVMTTPRDEYFITFQPHVAGGSIKITCCDASEALKNCYENYEHVVGFSATLKPFDFYSQLSGLERDVLKTAEFSSPFPRERRKLMILPQLSSKYSARERNYPRIAEAIEKIVALKRGNYLAFFPSFDFAEKVLGQFTTPTGFQVFKQHRGLKTDDVAALLEDLKRPGTSNIVFAVQGGVLAEGVDYPGEMVIGAFVVGTPLPNFNLEREEMRQYYERKYDAGFDYAYTYPAMAKAVQAAGRVIRSETDRGVIVLMDDRFVQPSFMKSMPQDWFDESPYELVPKKILSELEEFWASTEDQVSGRVTEKNSL